MDQAPRRTLYGRRGGPRLRVGRRRLLETVLPRLAVRLPETGRLDPETLFDRPVGDLWLEVGFGAGEHLAAQARAHPSVGIIGCEPYRHGMARLLSILEAEGLDVRLLDDDARLLLDALPDACLGRVFVLFPDPWPKARHHKRRFIQDDTLDALARTMKDGAELRFASDHGGYMRWTLARLLNHPDFGWTARRAADWRTRPEDWPETRYEQKARAQGRQPTFLRFRRATRRKA